MSGAPRGPLPILAWLGAPLAACAALQLLFALPVRIFGLQPPEPVFALAAAFAWGVIRPSVAPAPALLLLGLFLDLLWGAPLGFWPLCLLFAYAPTLVAREAIAGVGFAGQWAAYGAVCLIAFGAGAALTALRTATAPELIGLAWQWGASVLLFPFPWRLIQRYETADVRFR